MPPKPSTAARPLALALVLALGAIQAAGPARAQAPQTAPASGAGTPASSGTGSCAMTPPGGQKRFCMNGVPQAACAAYAREQRTTFEWTAGAECP